MRPSRSAIFKKIKKILSEIKKNVLLKNYTTFRIGGLVKYFFVAQTKEDLIKAILAARKFKLPFFILGGGSNLLIADKGYKGLVVKCQITNVKSQMSKFIAEAGTLLGKLVSISAKKGLTGLEWAIGIPGTIGGAIYGNAGAFGSSIKDIVKKVEVFNLRNQKIEIFKNKDCQFDYRDSIFRHNSNLIILSAIVQLKRGNKEKIKEKMKEYLNYRRERQPNLPSAGSIFKNIKLEILKPNFFKEFLEAKNAIKKNFLPTAYLIDKCGLKDKKIGDVKVSEKYANFIVNLGNGKAKDVKKLIKFIKEKVKNKFGISLKEEIVILDIS